jgi:hypothetical protein
MTIILRIFKKQGEKDKNKIIDILWDEIEKYWWILQMKKLKEIWKVGRI